MDVDQPGDAATSDYAKGGHDHVLTLAYVHAYSTAQRSTALSTRSNCEESHWSREPARAIEGVWGRGMNEAHARSWYELLHGV